MDTHPLQGKDPIHLGITLAANNQVPIDTRDYDWKERGFALSPFDWSRGYDIEDLLTRKVGHGIALAAKNQYQSYSCGGQAWSYLDAVQLAFASGTYVEKSAKFIYAQTNVQPGGGSNGRDNCNIAIKQGVCDESLCLSYQNGSTTEAFMISAGDINQAARDNAKHFLNKAYYNVSTTSIDDIAQAIAVNQGVVIGVYGSNNGTWLSRYPQPPVTHTGAWAHWVYAGKVKMENGKKYIGIKNSWGDACGDHGWQWLGEEYFTGGFVYSVWALTFEAPAVPVVVAAVPFTKVMIVGQNSADILRMQQLLKKDGVYPAAVPCTGYYGNITRNAVLKFQYKYHVASPAEINSLAGASVGPKTLAALNQINK